MSNHKINYHCMPDQVRDMSVFSIESNVKQNVKLFQIKNLFFKKEALWPTMYVKLFTSL